MHWKKWDFDSSYTPSTYSLVVNGINIRLYTAFWPTPDVRRPGWQCSLHIPRKSRILLGTLRETDVPLEHAKALALAWALDMLTNDAALAALALKEDANK